MKKVKSKEEWRIGNIQYPTSKPESEQSNHPITPVANGQRQVSGLRVGYGREGPPGRARSPGTGISPLRDHPPWEGFLSLNKNSPQAHLRCAPPSLLKREGGPRDFGVGGESKKNKFLNYKQMNINILINNKNKHFLTNNFLTIKFFKIMKKQILILAFLVLAIFASVNKSYGQAVHHSVPVSLVCPNDALHPIAGKEYTYDVIGTLGAGNYTYWATKDAVFYAADSTYTANLAARLKVADGELTAATDYGASSVNPTAKITWTTDLLAKTKYQATPSTTPTLLAPSPTFVAVHYTPTVAGTCADNFKVYELDPKNGFTVDILALDPVTKLPDATLYTYKPAQCVPNVTSAKYNAGKMDYLYGTSVMYYEVVASNFSKEWTPSFMITGLDARQKATIEWDYTTAFAAGTKVVVANKKNDGTYISPSAASTVITDTSNGVSIFVRVTIQNNSYEGLTNETLALAVDGKNSSGLIDAVNSDCTTPGAADYVDTIDQTLTARPDVTTGTSTTSTIVTNVGIIPKNP